MSKTPNQKYTADFKKLAVKRVASGESIAAIARDIGCVGQTLRNWVKAAKAGKLHASAAKVVTAEQTELSRLRAENARLRVELKIAKEAAAERTRTSKGAPRKTHAKNEIPKKAKKPFRYIMKIKAAKKSAPKKKKPFHYIMKKKAAPKKKAMKRW